MLLPVSKDVGLALRHVLCLHPSAFSPRLLLCLGCQRSNFTTQARSTKCQHKGQGQLIHPAWLRVGLGAGAVPTCSIRTSVTNRLWKTGAWGRAKDPSVSAADVKASSVTETASESKELPPSPESKSPPSSSSAAGGVRDVNVSIVLGSSGSSEGKEGEAKAVLKVSPKPRKVKSLEYSYTGNVYILPVRAMNEYLLKPSDLEGLPRYERRSPYESGPRITVYLRTDVETIAKQVWGSLENITKEKNRIAKKEVQNQNKYDLFQIRAILDEHRKSSGVGDEKPYVMGEEPKPQSEQMMFWKSGSARVVMSAILVNGLNSVMKLIAWLYTGSHSMFSEFIHSMADTMNQGHRVTRKVQLSSPSAIKWHEVDQTFTVVDQVILGIGLYHSIKKPDPDHPYGYSNLRNISSLISGVGIFFFGTGLSLYHGFQGFMHPEPLTSLNWGIATLVGAFVSEGATLIIAANQVRKSSKALGLDFWQYVREGVDPNVTVVLLEDMAAVLGVGVAGVCMALTQYYASSIPDALGSCIIGGILGTVASFVIYTNTSALVGKSIPFQVRQGMSQALEGDRMIRSLHDVKATHMGGQIRFKAEVDFDGREITRAYLYKLDMDLLLAEMKELQTAEQVEGFMLKHGESIIDSLGAEVDRIENVLKEKYPDLRHVDLEAL